MIARRLPFALFLLLAVGCGSSSSNAEPPPTDTGGSEVATDDGVDTADSAPPNPLDAKFAALIADMTSTLEAKKVPGGAIAIVIDGKLAYSAGIGIKRAGGTDPVTADSLFRVGSTTKMLIAMGVMQQVETGAIDLEKPATTYAPEFARGSGFDASKITVRHLLTHTSGIPDTAELNCPVDASALKNWIVAHNDEPLWSPPGRLWNYTNTGYALAALVLEDAAKTPFVQYVTEKVMKPAGMTTATFEPKVAMAGDFTSGHKLNATTGKYTTYQPSSFDCAQLRAAGGVLASVKDYAHLTETLIAKGGTVLKPSSVEAVEAPQVKTMLLPDLTYGYGWMQEPYKGVTLVNHDGAVPGWLASVTMIPEKKFAAIVFFNADHVSPTSFTLRAADAMLGLTGDLPSFTTSPTTWGKYEGVYDDKYGYLGKVTVTLEGSKLMGAFAADGSKVTLTQYAGDTFYFPISGMSLTGTFFLDDKGAGEFFATRAGVGAITTTAPPKGSGFSGSGFAPAAAPSFAEMLSVDFQRLRAITSSASR